MVWAGDDRFGAPETPTQYGTDDGIYRFIDETHSPAHIDSVRRYYDDIGWKDTDGHYNEAKSFVDERDFALQYSHKCMHRLQPYFERGGDILLDAGCGPIAHDEIRAYGDRFRKRFCLDLSVRALAHARQKLDDKGEYLQASLCEIPLRSNTIDAFICANVIYQLPEEDQKRAFLELWRVLRPGGLGLVIYWWEGSRLAWRFQRLARAMKLEPREAVPADSAAPGRAEPPNHSLPVSWFLQQRWPFRYELDSYRILTNLFMKTYLRDEWRSRLLLRSAYLFQTLAPSYSGREGAFAAIVVHKD